VSASRHRQLSIDLASRALTINGEGSQTMTEHSPPQAELVLPDQQPIALGTVEAGHPVIATGGPRISLRLHTIDGRTVDVFVHDLMWVGELEDQIRVLRRRANGLLGGAQ
jgi:hypothetical protein